ncbi:protegrin-1-like isoform X1 [Anomaloglossus baeobatrachus]|uniref:protegrin-1-like isoform X1 n=1 Tax=Anomaloglossus baeobatrachus TaxID=238106 RepID=UPI003F50AEFE
MRSWRASLLPSLLLSVITLHVCVSEAEEPRIQDGGSIRAITDRYNQKEGVTFLYKSLDRIHTAPPEGDEDAAGRFFLIQETVCPKSDNPDLSQCDFKPDGDVRVCALDLGDAEDVMCISQSKFQSVRVKRSGKKKKKCNNFFCKIFRRGSTSSIAAGTNTGGRVVA